MPVKPETRRAIEEAHSFGWLDPDIACHAGVSLSTVKRAQTELGSETHSVTVQRGKLGEKLFAQAAKERDLQVQWRERENGPYDLMIAGQRVDVKTTMQRSDDSCYFRLSNQRTSYFSRYQYPKNYQRDCKVIALVALFPHGHEADFYLFESKSVIPDILIYPSGRYEAGKNDWRLLANKVTSIQA